MAEDWQKLYENPEEFERTRGQNREAEIDYWVEKAKKYGGPVLELASGTGTICLPIAKAGFEVVGVDSSLPMVQFATKKAAGTAITNASFMHADFRYFILERKFNLIILNHHSLHHVNDLKSIEQLFTQIKEHLAPKGRVMIEDFNPGYPEFLVGRGRKRPTPRELRALNRVKWFDGDAKQRLDFFYPREYEFILAKFGLLAECMFGDFDDSAYTTGGMRLIVVAKHIDEHEQ